jgi:hypothetical protein
MKGQEEKITRNGKNTWSGKEEKKGLHRLAVSALFSFRDS